MEVIWGEILEETVYISEVLSGETVYIKRNFYKKILNSYLIMAALNIDNIRTFKIYKTQFTAMNNYIIKYNINYKKFLFEILSKSKTISPIIKPVKKNTIN